LVANGTLRHFAAVQQTVAFGGKADISGRAGVSLPRRLAFVADPTLQVFEASAIKEFGNVRKPPGSAIIHFEADDPKEGPILIGPC
jgi:hypothetical protein